MRLHSVRRRQGSPLRAAPRAAVQLIRVDHDATPADAGDQEPRFSAPARRGIVSLTGGGRYGSSPPRPTKQPGPTSVRISGYPRRLNAPISHTRARYLAPNVG